MEVEIISETFVKPTSSTPDHLKIHQLSLIAQIAKMASYGGSIFFFPANQDTSNDANFERSLVLKQSLAKTLTYFYPLAGKIRDDFSTDCDDKGMLFIEARVLDKYYSSLDEYLKQPDLMLLNKFLPMENSSVLPTPGSRAAIVKCTTFPCGGVVLGLFVAHTIFDASSMSSFVTCWANIARNNSNMMPIFDAHATFPPSNMFPREPPNLFDRVVIKGKAVTRRFVFNAQAIADLNRNATSLTSTNPSRVLAVSALLTKSITAAFKARSRAHRPTLITHTVDLRRRAIPPIPKCAIGNYAFVAPILLTTEDTELSSIVIQMREAIGKLDGDYIKRLKGDDGVLKLLESGKQLKESLASPEIMSTGFDYIGFISWCNMSLYEIDFGWGKTSWVTGTGPDKPRGVYINYVFLSDTSDGRGIEAWVTIGEEDMALVEVDKELLQYASIVPSPTLS